MRRSPSTDPCEVPDCGKRRQALGLCPAHYSRLRKWGDPLGFAPRSVYLDRGRTTCAVDECDTHIANARRGFCSKHDYKFRRYGDPLAGRTYAPRGSGSTYVDTNGYIVENAGGVKVLQHRRVMAEILGRGLAPHENVHHINVIRDDNRPENLELWVTPQPQGQRVSDLVAWVIENYRDEIAAQLTEEDH